MRSPLDFNYQMRHDVGKVESKLMQYLQQDAITFEVTILLCTAAMTGVDHLTYRSHCVT